MIVSNITLGLIEVAWTLLNIILAYIRRLNRRLQRMVIDRLLRLEEGQKEIAEGQRALRERQKEIMEGHKEIAKILERREEKIR